MEYLTLDKLNHHSFELEGYYNTTFSPYDMPFHCHNNYEIMYVKQGSCQIFILNEHTGETQEISLLDNQFLFLNAGSMHRLLIHRPQTNILNLEIKPVAVKNNFDFAAIIGASSSLSELLQSNPPYFVLDDIASVQRSIFDILNETTQINVSATETDYLLQLMISELFIKIARCSSKVTANTGIPHNKKAVKYIAENYSASDMSVNKIAAHAGVSESYLQRLFKNQFNMSVVDYVNKYRIKKAAYFISNSNMSIGMIAKQTGFNSRQHFNKIFLRHLDMTPTQFKEHNVALKFMKEDKDSDLLETELLHPNYI